MPDSSSYSPGHYEPILHAPICDMQLTSRKFRDWMYSRQTRNILSVLFQTVNHDVYKWCAATFTREHLTSSPSSCGRQGSGSLHTTMRGRMRHYQAKNFYRPHASCSPDFSLCDFFYSHYWKEHLKGHRHANIPAIQKAIKKQLCNIPEGALQYCFKDIQKSWKRCSDAGGSRFEEHTKHQNLRISTHFYTVSFRTSRTYILCV